MTYIEKLMSAIKFDEELLKQEEIERLRVGASEGIVRAYCPYMFGLLRISGAKLPEEIAATGDPDDCSFEGTCEDCWEQEIAQ